MTINTNQKEPIVADSEITQPNFDELYPECTKLQSVQPKSQTIGEFIEWMQSERNASFMAWVEDLGDYVPVPQPIEVLLAEFFEIDLQKVEVEKRSMLRLMTGG